jgi:CheY-like chemotaxis protein
MEQLRPLRVLIVGQQDTLVRVIAATIRNWGHESIVLPFTESLHESEASAAEGDVLVYDLDKPLHSTSVSIMGKERCAIHPRSFALGEKSTSSFCTLTNDEVHWRRPAFPTRFTIALSSRSVSRTTLEQIGAIALLYKPFEMGRLQRYLHVLQRLLSLGGGSGRQPHGRDGKARVLVVDDDVDIAHVIRESLLHSSAGESAYEVTVAHDGLEALEYWVDWHPDCIVTDLIMPWMNGYQVMRCLSAGALHTMPTFVVMSALRHLESVEHSFPAGKVVAYIKKPFQLDHLLTAIQLGCAG